VEVFRGQRQGEIGLTADEVRIIRMMRAVRGMSQLDLAKRSGVALRVISRLEKCIGDDPSNEGSTKANRRPEDLISIKPETANAIFDALETDTIRIHQVNKSIKVIIDDVASSGYFMSRANNKCEKAS
jgi:predicted transcriptional regulator